MPGLGPDFPALIQHLPYLMQVYTFFAHMIKAFKRSISRNINNSQYSVHL